MSFIGIGVGITAAGAIGKIYTGAKQAGMADKIDPQFNQYVENPYAKKQLGGALQAYNGRMAGASAQERNIASSQANFANNVSRNSTDGSQAIAMAGAAQGQADDSYSNLQIKEAQNKYNLLDNLNQAYQTNINEGDKVYNSMLQKYQMDAGAQASLRGAGFNNIFGGVQDLGATAIKSAGEFGKNKTPSVENYKAAGVTPQSPVTSYEPSGFTPRSYVPAPAIAPNLSMNNPSMAAIMNGRMLQPGQIPASGAVQKPQYPNLLNFNWLGK